MLIYWLLFIIPSAMAIVQGNNIILFNKYLFFFKLYFLFIFLLIGFRFEVGGDWYEYLKSYNSIDNSTLKETLLFGDPSDRLINFISFNLSLGIYFVNIIYSLIFSLGLYFFCKQQPRAWLASSISIPYLVIVVAMGYSRQAVAIGLLMIALVYFERGILKKYIFFICLATTFHKSALIMIPLALFINTKIKFIYKFIIIFFLFFLLFIFFLKDQLDNLIVGYIQAEYSSSGAVIRIFMNSIPAIIFLIFRFKFNLNKTQFNFWSLLCYCQILIMLSLMISPSSTAVDRIALYFIPIQIFVFSRLPDSLSYFFGNSHICLFLIISYYSIVNFVWLFFADHSFAWLPYKFYPLFYLWN